jgi:hypothetical protein
MYCPVYGCNSSNKGDKRQNISFFKFPPKKDCERRKAWVNFCKRKNFAPEHSRICSDHFSDKDFLTSHSPTFLASIGFTGKVNILLKPDAVPSKNAPGETAVPAKKTRPKGRLSQLKVTQHYLIYMF